MDHGEILKFHVKKDELRSAKRLLFILTKLASNMNINLTFLSVDFLIDSLDLKQNSSNLKIYQHCLEKCYDIITTKDAQIDPKILKAIIEFISEKLFEDEIGKTALENFFEGNEKLMRILFLCDSFKSVEYTSSSVFKLFHKSFESREQWIEVSILAQRPSHR